LYNAYKSKESLGA